MSEQPIPEFEDRLRTLLARAAEVIPADTDLSARVRHAHAQGMRRGGAGGGASSRHLLATIAAVLVVGLLAGVLTFARPGRSRQPVGGVTGASTTTATTVSTQVIVPPICRPLDPSTPPSVATPDGTPIDHSVAIGRHASLNGITLTIDRAYADTTQTIVSYHMQTNINPPLPYTGVFLSDALGHHYVSYSSSWSMDRGGTFVFPPLPPEKLSTPQTLTFVAPQMLLPNPTKPGPGANVDGPWQITFSLTPVAGTSVALHSTPLTRNGLTVQPLRLDVAPAGGGLDGATGGARAVVRLSGLVPGGQLSDLSFDAILTLGGGSSSNCGGGLLELVLPNGRQIMPGFVHPLEQTVSSSGTVDLEALFFTPIPSGTRITLYLDRLPVQIAGAAKSTQISGPWEFQLRPSS